MFTAGFESSTEGLFGLCKVSFSMVRNGGGCALAWAGLRGFRAGSCSRGIVLEALNVNGKAGWLYCEPSGWYMSDTNCAVVNVGDRSKGSLGGCRVVFAIHGEKENRVAVWRSESWVFCVPLDGCSLDKDRSRKYVEGGVLVVHDLFRSSILSPRRLVRWLSVISIMPKIHIQD